MGSFTPLNFGQGGTINGLRPGRLIKRAIDELQDKVVAAVNSADSEFEFARTGKNTLTFRRRKTSGVLGSTDPDADGEKRNRNAKLIDIGDVSYGPVASAKIRRQGGTYLLDLVFPRGDAATYGGDDEGGGGDFRFRVIEIPGGHKVIITNTDGSVESFDVMDGAQGEPGDDGFSPTVDVQPLPGGNGISITVTDREGQHGPYTVHDGQDGVVTDVATAEFFSLSTDANAYSLGISGGHLVLNIGVKIMEFSLSNTGQLGVREKGTTSISVQGPEVAACLNFRQQSP